MEMEMETTIEDLPAMVELVDAGAEAGITITMEPRTEQQQQQLAKSQPSNSL
jgi:hypothetical protein